jgi:hypothetical protein
MKGGARQNIFFMILSIYLVLAALLSLIAWLRESALLSLSNSLPNAIFLLYGVAGVFVGVSLISKKEIPRNFGFITLSAFAFLDGITTLLRIFFGNPPTELLWLLGTISLSSGVFFISQGEIWKNKNTGFILLSGYLIAIGIRANSYDPAHIFFIISALFALPAAIFFLRGK